MIGVVRTFQLNEIAGRPGEARAAWDEMLKYFRDHFPEGKPESWQGGPNGEINWKHFVTRFESLAEWEKYDEKWKNDEGIAPLLKKHQDLEKERGARFWPDWTVRSYPIG